MLPVPVGLKSYHGHVVMLTPFWTQPRIASTIWPARDRTPRAPARLVIGGTRGLPTSCRTSEYNDLRGTVMVEGVVAGGAHGYTSASGARRRGGQRLG